MGKIISISIFKGGTGKTTTAVALASALARRRKTVLLIDLDQQASATRHVGLDPEQESPNLFHVFTGDVRPSLAIKDTDFGFKIMTGHPTLAAIEEALEKGEETKLKELMQGIVPEFNYIVLDSPPGKAMLSINALASADEVIIPLQAERPALDGVYDVIKFIEKQIWENYNPDLKIKGILPTMVKRTSRHSTGVIKKAREIWKNSVFPMEVPESIIFSKSFNAGVPLPHFDETHDGAQAYIELAKLL